MTAPNVLNKTNATEDILQTRLKRLNDAIRAIEDNAYDTDDIIKHLVDHQHDLIVSTKQTIQNALNLLIKPKRHAAVIERIVAHWPIAFPEHLAFIDKRLQTLVRSNHLDKDILGRSKWPEYASNYMIIDWIKTSLSTSNSTSKTIDVQPSIDELKHLRKKRTPPTIPSITWKTFADTHASLSPECIAFLYLAESDIDHGLKRKSMAIDASRTQRKERESTHRTRHPKSH